MRDDKGRFVKGITPWNKNKKGVTTAWNKGKKLHYDVWMKGRKVSDETKRKISLSKKGCSTTPGSWKKGNVPWNVGKRHSEETRRKISLRLMGKPNDACRKLFLSKRELYKLYCKEDLTTYQIAERYGVTRPAIIYWLKKYDIPRKTTAHYIKKFKLTKEELHRLYWDERLPMEDIAKRAGVTLFIVYRWMRRFGIESGAYKGKHNPNYGRKRVEISNDKHWNWKGGITPLTQNIRQSSEYKKWHRAVFKRDNYICQCCKRKVRILHAHHIKPFADIIQENNIKTTESAINCPEMWDVDNGQTLCEECHRLIDCD